MWKRTEIKNGARAIIRANYWPTVMVCLLGLIFPAAFFFVDGMIGKIVVIALWILIGGPLLVGINRFLMDNGEGEADGADIMVGFGNYENCMVTMLETALIIAAFSLLLVVPGVMKAYELRMVPVILAEDPGKPRKECWAESRRLMENERYRTFLLDLTFLGWLALDVCTLGLAGIFWCHPYYMQTNCELYYILEERENTRRDFEEVDEEEEEDEENEELAEEMQEEPETEEVYDRLPGSADND